MRTRRVVIIGAGVGGLVAALLLAARGFDVTLFEKAFAPGGKMRVVEAGGVALDAGPTVFTMRWVFEEIFSEAGASFSDRVALHPVETLARHAWSENERLDLFADAERSADAIGAFAGPREAGGFRRFRRRAAKIYETLRATFILAERPSPVELVRRAGLLGLPGLARISPFTTMWDELGAYFRDARLRQLFARYATYCGSSPFQSPATLMLVAHVEMDGVWRIEGGMRRLAAVLAEQARASGAQLHFGRSASRILVSQGRVSGVELADGERYLADAVIMNGDVNALRMGLLGDAAATACPAASTAERSLSALTFALHAQAEGFPLIHHNVFFSNDYRAEFDDVFVHRRLPRAPTIYVCAQDRDDADDARGAERLFLIVNAPAQTRPFELSQEELLTCENTTFHFLNRCGLRVQRSPEATTRTSPSDFAQLFPATGGAIYGQASHGWTASFTRPGSRTQIPGLYLAGGSVHPGPGVPMAALSGRLAARCAMADLVSTRPWSGAAIGGGMLTH